MKLNFLFIILLISFSAHAQKVNNESGSIVRIFRSQYAEKK